MKKKKNKKERKNIREIKTLKTRISIMGESTSVFIQRCVKMKCAYGDLRILTISRIKRIKKYFFVLISFRNLVRSIDPTTCRSMFSEANVVKIVVNWRDPCFRHLRSPEQFEKTHHVCQLSVTIDNNVKNKWNWKWIQKVDVDGVPFGHWCRTIDELRVATKKQTKKTMKRRKELGSEVDIDPSSRNLV